MKFILLEKEKDSIKIEVADADQTIIQPIIVELNKDKNVESVLKLNHLNIKHKCKLKGMVYRGKLEI